jgi:hypothetical protein
MRTESTMCCRWVAYRMCMALCRFGMTCMKLLQGRENSLSLSTDQTKV